MGRRAVSEAKRIADEKTRLLREIVKEQVGLGHPHHHVATLNLFEEPDGFYITVAGTNPERPRMTIDELEQAIVQAAERYREKDSAPRRGR